jgi:hypothetical protein
MLFNIYYQTNNCMLIVNELSWQEYTTLPGIRNLSLNEQVRQYNMYMNEVLQTKLIYSQNQITSPAGGGETPSIQASQDLTLVFLDFATVDLFLTNGVENLADWNDRLVLTGNPYTSISVDEATYTIYLGGGSNVVLKDDAFNGYLENPTGLGLDLLSIQDNGTITEVGIEAFIACYNLTTVELLGATTIGDSAFSNCSGLQYVYLPNVTSVGANGFISAFNDATLPITLYLPLCTSLGVGALNGPINIDTPNGLTATFPIVMQTNGGGGGVNDEIQQLTAYSDGAIIVYV